MSAITTWVLGTEDGDHRVNAATQSGKYLSVTVDGREVVHSKAVSGDYGFSIGTHYASLRLRQGMSCWLRAAILVACFIASYAFVAIPLIASVASTSYRSSSRYSSSSSADSMATCAFFIVLGLLFVLDRMFLRSRASFVLVADGRMVPASTRVVLAVPVRQPPPPSYRPPAPPPAPAPQAQQPFIVQQSAPAAMVPDVPARCEMCGSPLSMDALRWTGPLSAACKTCGAPVPIQWKKIGG
jgi:hypothetical protein